MSDDPEPTLEQITLEFSNLGYFRREEVCTRLGIGEDILEICLQWEVIQAPEPDSQGTMVFSGEAIDRLSRGIRLHRDLGVNWPGVSLALELLDRIESLEQRIDPRQGW